jgi:excisionase family DNA binding protein
MYAKMNGDVFTLLRIDQVAERLAISKMTVRRLVERGELRQVRIGGSIRFRPQDVRALIDREDDDGPGAPGRVRSASAVEGGRHGAE